MKYFALVVISLLFLSACSDERAQENYDQSSQEKYDYQSQEKYDPQSQVEVDSQSQEEDDSQPQLEESQDENNSPSQVEDDQPSQEKDEEKSVGEIAAESEDVPVISLPFSTQDWPDSMVPMGETIFHPDPPNPGGHPGIDFQWQSGSDVKLLASMDGIVSAIKKNWDNYSYEFSIRNGRYGVDCGVIEVNPKIKVGQMINKGDYIGRPQGHHSVEERAKEPGFRMTHWQFGYVYDLGGMNRLCPTNYWDNESRVLIEKLWAEVPSDDMVKSKFPDICSGYYKGRDE